MTDYLEVAKHQAPTGSPVMDEWPGNGEFTGTRWIRTAWADRYAVINELGAMNGGAGQLWPYDTSKEAYLAAARCRGIGRATFDADGLAVYPAAIIELRYSTQSPVLYGSGYIISESIEPWKQHMSFNASGYGLRWGDANGDPVSGWLTRIDCRLVYVLAFHNILTGPTTAMTYVGGCNAGIVPTLTLGISFAPQTLLHSDPYVDRTIRMGYLPRLTLRYRWPYHPAGWNTQWNPRTGAWTEVYHPDYGQVISHTPVNFMDLYP